MNLDEIKELLRAVGDSDVAELEVESGDDKIRIRRRIESNSAPQPYVVVSTGGGGQAQHLPEPRAQIDDPRSPPPDPDPQGDGEEPPKTGPEGPEPVIIPSPMVGTFYEGPSPGAPAFVQPGDKIKQGQVLCIIEAMKLMNEIEAEVAGVLVKRFVSNAQPVEFGEALFAIDPDSRDGAA